MLINKMIDDRMTSQFDVNIFSRGGCSPHKSSEGSSENLVRLVAFENWMHARLFDCSLLFFYFDFNLLRLTQVEGVIESRFIDYLTKDVYYVEVQSFLLLFSFSFVGSIA
jgi:hypothetical protein